jgi:SNF2 family DNA or RNA helicase
VGELHDLLMQHVMIRRRKRDVLSQLPKQTTITVPVDMSKPSEYRKAEKDVVSFLEGRGKLTGSRRIQAVTKFGILMQLAAELKLGSVVDRLDDFLNGTEEKVIVGAIHKLIVKHLSQKYHKTCVVIDGSTPMEKRQGLVDQFQQDPDTRMLIGNMQASGLGWDMTAASYVLFAELDFVPAVIKQFAGRAHRIGTEYPVTVEYLVAKDTVEEKVCRLLQKKQKTLDRILDGKDYHELDIYDALVSEYRKENDNGKV